MKTEAQDPRAANYQRDEALQSELDKLRIIEGVPQHQSYPVAIIVGRWHQFIADRLLAGALAAIDEAGIGKMLVDVIYVPGAYEIPLAAQQLAGQGKYRAIITLGVVIRGDTPHFDFVAGECSRGIAQVSQQHSVPIGFGVLTVNDADQALQRAADGEANKGREAAMAALEMADLLARLR